MSKREFFARHPKTDLRYWEKAIFQPTYTRDGEVRKVGEWAAKIQHLGRRETFSLGGANSDVEVDAELLEIFRGFRARATGDFVIESKVAPRPGATYSHYRCQRLFEALGIWLRDHGIPGNKPLHTLRKEFGSQVCAKHGIYAASHALRHADIAITSQHYLDKRKSATAGLGKFLSKPANVIPIIGKIRRHSKRSVIR